MGEASSNQPSQWEKDIYDSKLGIQQNHDKTIRNLCTSINGNTAKTMTKFDRISSQLSMVLPKNYPITNLSFLKIPVSCHFPRNDEKNGNIKERIRLYKW